MLFALATKRSLPFFLLLLPLSLGVPAGSHSKMRPAVLVYLPHPVESTVVITIISTRLFYVRFRCGEKTTPGAPLALSRRAEGQHHLCAARREMRRDRRRPWETHLPSFSLSLSLCLRFFLGREGVCDTRRYLPTLSRSRDGRTGR